MINEIRLIAEQIAKTEVELGGVKIYAFGSATHSNSKPNDIDILVIYSEAEQPKLLRALLENLLYIRVHLIFMTQDEEAETDFVRLQNCIPIDYIY